MATDNREWFRNAKFGMMIHWGLYCLPAGEWKGRRLPQNMIGEWIQQNYTIPNAEYHKLAAAFNPVFFDADEWARLAADAGMKYMVVTAKHHEGFAMFRSKADKFNICDATPFGRDVIAELSAACRRHGLKFGLYYSQDLDWSHPDGGGYTRPYEGNNGYWCNAWDFPREGKDFSRYFENKVKPQVTELLTNYGDLCLIWFDTPMTISPEQSKELADLVHRYQPECLINSRIGNGMGDYTSMGDNEIPEGQMGEGLFESACTLNDTWGYKTGDLNWKSPEKIIELKNRLNSRGLNYLLNVGPDYLGRIPGAAVDILRAVGKAAK